MVRIKVRLSSKGQLVIPKIIRESVGLQEEKDAIMEVRGKPYRTYTPYRILP